MVVEIDPLSKNVTLFFEYSYVNLIVGCCWLADLMKSFRSCSELFHIRIISPMYLSQREYNMTQLFNVYFSKHPINKLV